MTEIIMDSNFVVANYDKNDKWNPKTNQILEKLSHYEINIVITDIVINESLNVLAKRYESKNSTEKFNEIAEKIETDYGIDDIEWISENLKENHIEIMALLKKTNGLLNYNDCMLISYMKINGIKYILSFDEDFDKINDIKRIKSIDDIIL